MLRALLRGAPCQGFSSPIRAGHPSALGRSNRKVAILEFDFTDFPGWTKRSDGGAVQSHHKPARVARAKDAASFEFDRPAGSWNQQLGEQTLALAILHRDPTRLRRAENNFHRRAGAGRLALPISIRRRRCRFDACGGNGYGFSRRRALVARGRSRLLPSGRGVMRRPQRKKDDEGSRDHCAGAGNPNVSQMHSRSPEPPRR